MTVATLPQYEALLLLTTTADIEGAEKTIAQFGQMIETLGGKLAKSEAAGRKRLAVNISKQAEGLVLVLLFTMPPDKISVLQRQVKLMDTVLRMTVIRTESTYDAERNMLATVIGSRENRTPETMAARITEMREQGVGYGDRGGYRGGRGGNFDRNRGPRNFQPGGGFQPRNEGAAPTSPAEAAPAAADD
ncbi:MAG: 30S ribosomal protein S6 [Vampirovibrionales bacterium]|nr:30S ribosomal protein S6 [Vampirovibrionales bacterium]